MKLRHVEKLGRGVSQRHVDHAMVDQVREVSEVSGLLSTLLRAGAHKRSSKLASQLLASPESASCIPESLDLCRWLAKACRQAKHDTIVAAEGIDVGVPDRGNVWFWRRTHSGEHSIRQGLVHLVEIDLNAFLLCALRNRVGQFLDVPVHRVVHNGNLDGLLHRCLLRALHRPSKHFRLSFGNLLLRVARHAAAVWPCKSTGSPGTAAVQFGHVKLLTRGAVSQRHVGDAMVDQARNV
mmetsp:Transcript_11304/g.19792  ORF Transcript_11304/g.19792 Transcript_11304/m.19792 type:complete len:238 (-) Transcript_11304:8-721(-)